MEVFSLFQIHKKYDFFSIESFVVFCIFINVHNFTRGMSMNAAILFEMCFKFIYLLNNQLLKKIVKFISTSIVYQLSE